MHMTTKQLFSISSTFALKKRPHGTLTIRYNSVLPAVTLRQGEHSLKRYENLIHTETALRRFPTACIVQRKCCHSGCFFINKHLQIGKTLRKLFTQYNFNGVESSSTYVSQLIYGQFFGVKGLHLVTARDVFSAFSSAKTASTMEVVEMVVVASDISVEILKTDSSQTKDNSNDSSALGDLGCLGNSSGLVERVEFDKETALGDAVVCKDAANTGTSLALRAKDEATEFSGRETDADGDVIEFSNKLTEVTDRVPDVSGKAAKMSDAEFDGKNTDNSQRVRCGTDANLTMSDPIGTDHQDSKECDRENTASSERASQYAEKLGQFKAKLACNQTILPPELLLKVAELAARRHMEGDAMHLTSEFLDQPPVEFVGGLQKPEDDWRHEMETIFMSYFEVADSKASASKPKKEKKTRSGEKLASERPKRVEPSHFVAIQITNSEIHEKIAEIQQSVVTKKHILENALVNLPTLHITLMVLYLKDNEQIERAKTALEASKTRILEHGKDLAPLPFAGIGDFNGKVVFAKVQEGPELDRLKEVAETVRQSFADQELFSTDSKGFQAHLTIMKLSKSPWLFKKGIKKINPDFYVTLKDDYLGSQPIRSLQLCAMKKGENGYYPIDHEVFFELEA